MRIDLALIITFVLLHHSLSSTESEEIIDSLPGKTNSTSHRTKNIVSLKDKEREGRKIAKTTLQLGSTEHCEWNLNPIQLIKGKLCGAYYKVLGLDRALGPLDKSGIKKAYRSKSLQLHPDKNPAPEASAAFKLVQDAYECLISDDCARQYEDKLLREEYAIQDSRDQIKEKIIEKSINAFTNIHYVISLAASHVYNLGLDVWETVGEFEMNIFGAPHKVGQYLLISGLILTKGRIFLQIHLMAYLISKVNYELAKAKGLF